MAQRQRAQKNIREAPNPISPPRSVGLVMGAVVATALLLGAQDVVAQRVQVDSANANKGTLDNALVFGGPTQLVTPGGVKTFPPSVGIASDKRGTGTFHIGGSVGGARGLNSDGMDFITNGVRRVSITSDGLLGVGTTSPTRTVEIQHGADVEVGLQSTDAGGRLWTIQSSGSGVEPLTGTFQIIDRTAGKARIVVDSVGIVSVGVLRITGGSDIAEPFELSTGDIPKGSVVTIDAANPGLLELSRHSYDTRVAGIVSGANGVNTGLSLADLSKGGQDVALSGRVYALADATHAPIAPGDLLTTSDIPGHCMKATDRDRARGAIIGKAMSALDADTGVVLVLVSLQ